MLCVGSFLQEALVFLCPTASLSPPQPVCSDSSVGVEGGGVALSWLWFSDVEVRQTPLDSYPDQKFSLIFDLN